MSTPTARTFDELRDQFGESAKSAAPGSRLRWLNASVHRHLKALLNAPSLADATALLREILRLQGWVYRFPQRGFPIGAESWPYLSRVGVYVQPDEDSVVVSAEARPRSPILPKRSGPPSPSMKRIVDYMRTRFPTRSLPTSSPSTSIIRARLKRRLSVPC